MTQIKPNLYRRRYLVDVLPTRSACAHKALDQLGLRNRQLGGDFEIGAGQGVDGRSPCALAGEGVEAFDPGDAIDKDLYDLPPEELAEVPTVCGSLREALDSLDADRDYLKKGDVFTDDTIDGYMELKWEEVYTTEHAPHPVEFMMYYSC